MIDPYLYIRTITMTLAALWTLSGLLRLRRFVQRWSSRLDTAGLSRRWLRRVLVVASLRVLFLDPINLALILFLLGTWTFRRAS